MNSHASFHVRIVSYRIAFRKSRRGISLFPSSSCFVVIPIKTSFLVETPFSLSFPVELGEYNPVVLLFKPVHHVFLRHFYPTFPPES